MSIEIRPAEVPAQSFTRAKEPNPYLDAVAALAAHVTEEGRSAVASAVTLPDEDVKRNVNLMREAGAEHGVTVRKRADENGDGTTTVTFWTTPRIARPRKVDKTDKA